jgi:DNA-directed RNA polymerase specialized sigma24 family protein
LDEALTAFSEIAPRQAKVVELRYFGGLTEEDIVAVLPVSPRTVRRDWDLSKAWLLREFKSWHRTNKGR